MQDKKRSRSEARGSKWGRDDYVKALHLPEPVHRRLKLQAFREGKDIREMAAEILERELPELEG